MSAEDSVAEDFPLLVRLDLRRYKPNYRLKWLKNKGAVLVVSWSYLAFSVFHFMILGSNAVVQQRGSASQSPTGIILLALTVLFPVGGWLADAYLGRHKMIRYSMWIMWISVITIILWYILSEYVYTKYLPNSIKVGLPVILYILMTIGLVGFQANIIQLGIDQLTDSSATEITSFITSYVFTLYASGVGFQFINSCYSTSQYAEVTIKGFNLLVILYIAVCLTLAICLDFIFGSCLVQENVPVATNSLSLIAKVLRYVLVNRNRCFEETTSVYDVAKHQFGGPFQNYHVDQVKTFLRMTVVIALGTVAGSQIIAFAYAQGELQLRFRDWSSYNCYAQTSISYSDYICGTIVVVVYELVIYPLFNKCIPTISTSNVFMMGIFLSILRIIAFLSVEIGAYLEQQSNHSNVTISPPKSCRHDDNIYIRFSPLSIIIIGSLEGLYSLMFFLSGFEFMWAHSPSSMKGLIFGTMYAFFGINVMLQSAISAPFLFFNTMWSNVPLTCGIWYFMMEAGIVFVVFAVFFFIIKRYKKSQRSEVDLHPVSLNDDPGYS